MIRIIRYIFFTLFWYLIYNKIKKSEFTDIFDNLNVQLRALSFVDTVKFLIDIVKDNLIQNTILNAIALPFNLSISSLFDTKTKKWYLFMFVFSIITNRWLYFLKKIMLIPFKLGIFTFLYSIIGIDLTWVLTLFNFFTVNIPYWIYLQYLTLYNNWLGWWYNTVNIKSIKSVSSSENSVSENNVSEKVRPKSSKNFWLTLGLLTLFGALLSIWYFDFLGYLFDNSGSGSGAGSSSSAANSSPTPSQNPQDSHLDNPHQIPVNNNQTKTSVDPVQLMNKSYENMNKPGSSRVINPWRNRFSPWEQLNQDRPDSPTGSDDSSDTITPSSNK